MTTDEALKSLFEKVSAKQLEQSDLENKWNIVHTTRTRILHQIGSQEALESVIRKENVEMKQTIRELECKLELLRTQMTAESQSRYKTCVVSMRILSFFVKVCDESDD